MYIYQVTLGLGQLLLPKFFLNLHLQLPSFLRYLESLDSLDVHYLFFTSIPFLGFMKTRLLTLLIMHEIFLQQTLPMILKKIWFMKEREAKVLYQVLH